MPLGVLGVEILRTSSPFFFSDTATTKIYTLSLHDALPIWHPAEPWTGRTTGATAGGTRSATVTRSAVRSEEHTSELQSRFDIVCRLLLEKKKYVSLVTKVRSLTNRTPGAMRRQALDGAVGT